MRVNIFHKVETQHYVPRHYLSAWSKRIYKKGKKIDLIACRIKDRLLSNIDTMTIGQEGYLYAYPEFNEYEFNMVVALLKSKQGLDGETIRYIYQYSLFLPLYIRSLKGERTSLLHSEICKLSESGILASSFSKALINSFNTDVRRLDQVKLSKFIDDGVTAMNNGFEYWMTKLENLFNPLLDRARNGDLSFMAERDNRPAFIHNLINQMLRTQKFDNLASDMLEEHPHTSIKVATYLRHLSAYEVASSLTRDADEYELNLICNNTALEFITGDQPLCNLVSNEDVGQFDVYYPISPTLALFFSKKGRFSNVYGHLKNPDVHEVDTLNKAICVGHYFASNWQQR